MTICGEQGPAWVPCSVALTLWWTLETAAAAPAGLPEPDYSGWALLFDNDLLALDSWTRVNDDRNYTMGLALTFGGSRFGKSWFGPSRAWLDDVLASHKVQPYQSFHALTVGVTAFTPNDLEVAAPIPGDRPYASLVFIANQKTSADNENKTAARRSILSVGALGLDIAKSTQRFLHNKLGVSNQDPLGWDNQISEGGELTFLYGAERMWLLARRADHFDVATNLGYKVGYYTVATAGVDLRFGPRVVSDFYEHTPNPLGHANLYVMSRAGRPSVDDNYGFFSYQATLVGYNALLQGQVRSSAQTFSWSELHRLVHWAAAGWVYERGPWKLTYSFNYRSREYMGLEARSHFWGGIYVTVSGG